MDRITKSFISELLKVQDLNSEGVAKDFEKLVNYSVISNNYSKTFDINSIGVGDGNDTGIDGIAIIVNGLLIENTEEIINLIETNGSLEITYIFIQSKTSSKFEGKEMNNFFFGIKDFFAESPKLVRNNDIKRFATLSNFLFEKASTFKQNPNLILYYVTTGTWNSDDQNHIAVIDQNKLEIQNLNLFSTISIHPLGARELAAAYRKTKESNSAKFKFENRITIPTIEGITESYIGLVPFSEFSKIIIDDSGKLLDVFEDNVRDYQGSTNDVNKVISKTINSSTPELFSVLNNGVTIVASAINSTGDDYTIKDYQIVNGCQTSNVLFDNREVQNARHVRIPIKLIATTDEEIKNQITLATNNQTPIKKEQLASLTEFQRNLEQYYNSFEGDLRLHYERRSKQYNSDSSVTKTKIITIPIQIKAFSSMFLETPHLASSFFGTIVKMLNKEGSKIFQESHLFKPYYTSALAYYRLETFFRKKSIDVSYKRVRFHLLLIFRLLISDSPLPQLNSKAIDTLCDKILEVLNKEDRSLETFLNAIEVINQSPINMSSKQHIKQVTKTSELINTIKGCDF